MVRTQIQLPDTLYARAKAFAADREMSLAELARRGLELLLERYPAGPAKAKQWKLPRIEGTGPLKVPLDKLRDVLFADEESRGLPRR